jgi:hypothetical protein
MNFANAMEAKKLWAFDMPSFKEAGIVMPDVQMYRLQEWAHDYRRIPARFMGMAGDAIAMVSTANAGIQRPVLASRHRRDSGRGQARRLDDADRDVPDRRARGRGDQLRRLQ